MASVKHGQVVKRGPKGSKRAAATQSAWRLSSLSKSATSGPVSTSVITAPAFASGASRQRTAYRCPPTCARPPGRFDRWPTCRCGLPGSLSVCLVLPAHCSLIRRARSVRAGNQSEKFWSRPLSLGCFCQGVLNVRREFESHRRSLSRED